MQVVRTKCHNCGVLLDVKNSKNETVKELACPRCQAILRVEFNPVPTYGSSTPFARNEGETQLGGDYSAETQLGDSPYNEETIFGGEKNGGSLPWLSLNGIDYPLSMGVNIIGRKGVTSQATVQIASEDRYMSRQHCRITLIKQPDGAVKSLLSNYKNKNLTSVDGQEIGTGDEIRLSDGNAITMGHTTVMYKE